MDGVEFVGCLVMLCRRWRPRFPAKPVDMTSPFACSNFLRDCECIPFPARNFSVEEVDVPVCFGHYNLASVAGTFFSPGCFRDVVTVVTTSISECEIVANQVAQREAFDCSNDGPGGHNDPDTPPPPFRRTQYSNQLSECTVECPDGSTTTEFVDAGTIHSFWQADANARARALACKLARRHQICFITESPLASICKNEFMSIVFDVAGGLAPYVFTVDSGSIPAGLELNDLGNMFGTPTSVGQSTFTLRVTDDNGAFQIKQFTIRVIEITSPVSLPAGTTGTPYSYTLTQSGAGTPLWALADGTLPDGLTLNSLTGEISGTPTESGTSIFTLTLLDGGNEICSKAFDLQIVAAVGLLAYWTFDDYDIDNLILDSTTNDFDITYATVDGVIEPGKVGNCFRPGNGTSLPVNTGNFALLNNAGATGFTMCGWVKLNPADNAGAGQIRSVRWSAPTSFMELEFLNGDMILNADGDAFEFEQITYPYPQDGGWHFYRVWYDPADQKARLQIDNGLIIDTVALTMAGGTGNQITFAGNAIFSGSTERSLDESGLWIRVLSDAEAASLWNGGLGTTFPSVPP